MIVIRVSVARALVTLACAAALAAAALALLTRHAAAQAGEPPQRAFVVLRGNDTLVVQRVTNMPGTIDADLAIRGIGRLTYRAELVQGPAIPYLTFQQYGPGAGSDAAPLASLSLRVSGDSAVMEANLPTGMQRFPKAVGGWALPFISNDFALIEPFIARARQSKASPYSAKVFVIQGTGVVLDASVTFIGGDSAAFTIGGQTTRFSLGPSGRITGGVIPSAGLRISVTSGGDVARIALGRTDYGAPAGAPYTAEEVTVKTRAGHSLTGTLTVPRNADGPVPAIVLVTGSGQQDRDEFISLIPGYRPFRQIADTLGRRGIAVLRMDDRGVNGSGGDVVNATTADFAEDIRAGIAYLRARKEIDPDRVGLFGHSEGGMIGPMVAASDPRLASLVIAAGPAYTGRKIIDFQLRNLVMGNDRIAPAQKDSATKVSIEAWDSTARNSPWMQFFLTYDPVPTLKKVKTPTLILQGATDQQVTPEQAPLVEKALRDGGNRNVTLRVFPQRNHLFLNDSVGFPGNYTNLKNVKISGDVLGPLADWLVATMQAKKPTP